MKAGEIDYDVDNDCRDKYRCIFLCLGSIKTLTHANTIK